MSETGYGDFEFERRFFVRGLPDAVRDDPTPTLIVQSYFLAVDGYAMRLRVQADGIVLDPSADLDAVDVLDVHADRFDFCALTVKGPQVGGTRYEAEREIDVHVGIEMMRRGGARSVKNRYSAWLGDDGWVVDVFAGRNRGLVIAECERGTPVTNLSIPSFCVTEVTEDRRFANESLAHTPFPAWQHEFARELADRGPTFSSGFGTNTLASPLA